jgi:hypothetical protein
VPKAGGSETVLGSASLYPAQKSAFAAPETLALVGDTLYLRSASGNEIWKLPKAGGTPSAIFTNDTDPQVPMEPPTPPSYSIGVDAQAVYFSRAFWTNIGSSYTSGVYRAALGGGAPTLIAEDQNTVNTGVGHAGTVVLDGSKLIWAWWHEVSPGSDGKLASSATDGSSPSTLTQTAQVQGIAVDATDAYYAEGPFLMHVAKTGGPPALVGQLPGISPIGYGVVVDATYAYVGYKDLGALPGQCGGLARIPKAGGAAIVMATGDRPAYLALDSAAVYYTDLEAGTVMRVALP